MSSNCDLTLLQYKTQTNITDVKGNVLQLTTFDDIIIFNVHRSILKMVKIKMQSKFGFGRGSSCL